jgi:glucan-binding YG repeat protein
VSSALDFQLNFKVFFSKISKLEEEKIQKKMKPKKKNDDVKETKEWVSSELEKLRMRGVRVLPQPLVEIEYPKHKKTTPAEKFHPRVARQKSRVSNKSKSKEDPVSVVSDVRGMALSKRFASK